MSRIKHHDASEDAFAAYCRNAKPPINSDDTTRLACAVVSFSAGWEAAEKYLLAHIDAQAAQIEKLRAALEYIGNRSASPWVQKACQSALAATADGEGKK